MKMKIALALLALNLSCLAYAGHPETPMPVSNDINVTAPEQVGSWSFGAEAVLMQPTNKTFVYADDLDGADIGNITGSGGLSGHITLNDDHESVNEGYDWWFGVDVTYHFPSHGLDATLAYEGLHGTDTDSTFTTANLDTKATHSANFLMSPFSGFPYSDAEGKTDTAYDAADLVFGQVLNVNHRVQLHPFFGIRYAHLDMKDTGDYFIENSDLFSNGNITGLAEESSLENRFDGVGPRLGSDMQINLCHGFSVRARLAASALIGSQRVTNNAEVAVFTTLNPNAGVSIDNNTDSETRLIPEVDARLGVNYLTALSTNKALSFELGWQATNYFNVIADQYPAEFGVFGAKIDFDSSLGNERYSKNSNFGIQGPYARVQLDIA